MPARKLLVLIVDDSMPVRMMLRNGLTKEGYEVCETTDGEQAILAFKERRPDVIIMDVKMPIMDGFDTVKEIRKQEQGRPTPILMLTASDDVESIHKAFDVGATDFMSKPVNLPLLLLRLKFTVRDVERDQILNRVEQDKENARLLFGILYWEFNIKSRKVSISHRSTKTRTWLDSLPENVDDFIQLLSKSDQERFTADIASAVDNDKPFDIEVVCEVNTERHILRIVGQSDETGKYITGALQDITEKRSLENQANHLSFYDQVTGLPNQKLFIRSIETDLSENPSEGKKVTVLVMEIKNLPSVANAYGNAVVETLLRRIGAELRRLMPNSVVCAKLESNAFAIKFSSGIKVSIDAASKELHQRLSQLNKSWFIAGREIFIKLTAGIAEAIPGEQTSASGLLRMAKSAQLETRSNKDLVIGKYNANANKAMKNRLDLEAELHKALQNDEFDIQYQPQLDVESGKIVGVEALIRLQTEERGFISPADFVPILEETGLIVDVGYKIFEKSVQQQVAWANSGLTLRVGINLSAVQFQSPDLSQRIVNIVKKYPIDRALIELEVTESATMDDPQHAIDVMRRLRSDGFRIALDDFGTGYSSFEYLLHFELDKLKIDKAFINNITHQRKDRALIRAINYLSDGLDLKTIAEGVETRRQFDYLDALGVGEIQGYFISKPLWADELYQFAVDFNKNTFKLD